jgi:hypothetical protein
MPRDHATDAALRSQPRRGAGQLDDTGVPDRGVGTDFLPSLPRAPIWEPVASGGGLLRAIEESGHRVFTGDIGAGQDFFSSSQLHLCQVLITIASFNQLDRFFARVVSLVESPDNRRIAAGAATSLGCTDGHGSDPASAKG